jgi:HD-GYP domain-containing protein (c-di-GMP phosphodiesterase class II)
MASSAGTPEPAKYAEALALVLQEEFGVPFTLVTTEHAAPAFGDEIPAGLRDLDPAALLGPARQGQVSLCPLPDGRRALVLPLFLGGQLRWLAVGAVPPEPVSGSVLERWAQAVADRLRLRQELDQRRGPEDLTEQAALAWEALLTVDSVGRRLRLHKEPDKNQQLILDAALPIVQADALIWLPRSVDLAPVVAGDSPLTPADAQRLITALTKESAPTPGRPFISNQVQEKLWGTPFPAVRSLLLFQTAEQAAPSWLLALNKYHPRGFRKTDAAVLSPFLALLEMYVKNFARFQDLKELLVGLTRSLTAAIDAKDPYTLGHSERVARIAVEIARNLGFAEAELGDVYLAGLLHDIGKIGIHDSVLRKPGTLTTEEFEHVKQHVTISYSILADLRAIRGLLPGVLYHHERWDGSGYPDGLKGEEIPLLARVLAVADAYESMSSMRPYRDALPCLEVEARLQQGAGTHWDPKVVAALLQSRQAVHAIRQCGIGESLRVAIETTLRSRSSPPAGGGERPAADGPLRELRNGGPCKTGGPQVHGTN